MHASACIRACMCSCMGCGSKTMCLGGGTDLTPVPLELAATPGGTELGGLRRGDSGAVRPSSALGLGGRVDWGGGGGRFETERISSGSGSSAASLKMEGG